MKIDAYYSCVTHGSGEITQMSAGAFVLLASDGCDVRKRSMAFGLNSSDPILSEIMTIKLVLSSISPKFRKNRVTLYSNNEILMLAVSKFGNSYAHEPTIHVDAFVRCRKIADLFTDLYISGVHSENEHVIEAKNLANGVAITQKACDTGTSEPNESGE